MFKLFVLGAVLVTVNAVSPYHEGGYNNQEENYSSGHGHQTEKGYYVEPHYSFAYTVHDSQTGDYKSHKEERQGDHTQGVYSLKEPEGGERIVEYLVEGKSGFNAKVIREGTKHVYKAGGYSSGGYGQGAYGKSDGGYVQGATSYASLNTKGGLGGGYQSQSYNGGLYSQQSNGYKQSDNQDGYASSFGASHGYNDGASYSSNSAGGAHDSGYKSNGGYGKGASYSSLSSGIQEGGYKSLNNGLQSLNNGYGGSSYSSLSSGILEGGYKSNDGYGKGASYSGLSSGIQEGGYKSLNNRLQSLNNGYGASSYSSLSSGIQEGGYKSLNGGYGASQIYSAGAQNGYKLGGALQSGQYSHGGGNAYSSGSSYGGAQLGGYKSSEQSYGSSQALYGGYSQGQIYGKLGGASSYSSLSSGDLHGGYSGGGYSNAGHSIAGYSNGGYNAAEAARGGYQTPNKAGSTRYYSSQSYKPQAYGSYQQSTLSPQGSYGSSEVSKHTYQVKPISHYSQSAHKSQEQYSKPHPLSYEPAYGKELYKAPEKALYQPHAPSYYKPQESSYHNSEPQYKQQEPDYYKPQPSYQGSGNAYSSVDINTHGAKITTKTYHTIPHKKEYTSNYGPQSNFNV